MLIRDAKRLAREWVERYAQDHRILGAYLGGSVIEMEEDATLPDSSDVDINLVIDGKESSEKPGKLLYRDALLEASFIQMADLFPAERLLLFYEIVGAFRKDNILLDPDGLLRELQKTVAAAFAKPCWVQARMRRVTEKILHGTGGFRTDTPLLDNINPWLFPAGICTHLLMVGALVNPTVRLRYLKVRPVLLENGYGGLYEKLLGLLGCSGFTQEQTQRHLDALADTFDVTCRYAPQTHFPFSNDIGPHARAVVVDGSRQLIRQGDYREAVFWMAATFVRCHLILRETDGDEHQRLYPAMLRLFADMGVDSNASIARKIREIHGILPELEAAAAVLYEKNGAQYTGDTVPCYHAETD